ncbi:MAG TPA: hypothetical protein VGH43_19265 [Jatrophihabitans sp.]|jgi:hypothetical protein
MIALEILARAKGGEGVKSGPIGLAVILLLCVAVYFLFKSMSKHLKRVRDEFPSDPADQAQPPQQGDSPSTEADSAPAEPDQPPSEADPARRSDPSP